MHEEYRFRVIAWWASGQTGMAKSNSAPNVVHFTAPPACGGMEGRWTPADLLFSALASSYTITFRQLAENSHLEYKDLQVEVEGTISGAETGYEFGEVRVHANLTIAQEANPAQAIDLLYRTEKLCPVSRALAIRHTFLPTVHSAMPLAPALA